MTAWPATVTVPVRDVVALLAATVNVTLPVPDPLVGDAETQLAPELAFQEQPDVFVTETVKVPPLLPGVSPVGDTE